MGADLLTCWADIPIPVDPNQGIDSDACRAACDERIEAFLQRDDAVDIMEEITDFTMGMSLEEALEDADIDTWQEYAKRVLSDAVKELFPPDNGWCRDATTLMVHGHPIILVGGTSWGDSFPALDAMGALLTAEILTADTGNNAPPSNVIRVG